MGVVVKKDVVNSAKLKGEDLKALEETIQSLRKGRKVKMYKTDGSVS